MLASPLHRFVTILDQPLVVVPIANYDDNQHAPDENPRLAILTTPRGRSAHPAPRGPRRGDPSMRIDDPRVPVSRREFLYGASAGAFGHAVDGYPYRIVSA